MKTAIMYTVLSVVNLVGFAVGLTFLPPSVPVHFNIHGAVNGTGSPWVFVAVPACAALISAGLWAATFSRREKNRAVATGLLSLTGALLVCLGWVFFGLAAGGAQFGEKTNFPFPAATVLPLSLLLVFFGNRMPRIKPTGIFGIRANDMLKSETVWVKTHRAAGIAFITAGLISAVCAVVFSCLGELAYVSLIVLAATVCFAVGYTAFYAHMRRKEELRAGDQAPVNNED